MKIAVTRVYFIAAVYWPYAEIGEEVKATARLGMGGEGSGLVQVLS